MPSSSWSRALQRASAWMVAAAARLVPPGERPRWQQEWQAELAHRSQVGERGGYAALLLFARAVGSVKHALWLQKEEWRWDMLSQDFRYAVRTLLARPGFVLAAALTLAVGIGANAALFSVIDAVLLRPLPYPEPQELLTVFESNDAIGGTRHGPSPANVLDWRRQATQLDGISAWWVESTTLIGDGATMTDEIPSARVTEDFFSVLGVEPLMGRTFLPDEVRTQTPVSVLSYELWQSRFGGDEEVIGREILFDDASWNVIGVMPSGFRTPGTLPGEVQLFKPWDFDLGYAHLDAVPRDSRFLRAAARLSEEATLETASDEIQAIAAAIAEAHPATNEGWGVTLVPLREALVGSTRQALLILLGAVGFVLLLACANVTSLLLVRASGRSREMAVRTALGASRLRLIRQLFVESALLSTLGCVSGLILAAFAVRALVGLAPGGIPRIEETALDARVILFAAAASILAGLIAGLAPAFQGSAVKPSESLKDTGGSVSSDRARQRLRTAIVVAEIAAAAVLLTGSGLFLRSFNRVMNVELGFTPSNILVARMRLDGKKYGGGGAHPYYRELLERLRALPGVVAAGGTTGLPMDELDIDFDRPYWNEGEPRPDGGGAGVQVRMPTIGYFETMHIPLLSGRAFDERDDRSKPRVASVNQTMAERNWPDESPIGKRIFIDYQGYQDAYEVVGVVGDTRFYGHKSDPRPAVYIPHAQNPYLPLNLVIRTQGDPTALARAVRKAALDIDPAQPFHSVQTMQTLMGSYTGQDRFAALLMSSFAAMALLLAAIGIYGVVAFSVNQRRRELGLRLALGANANDILKLVLGAGLRMAGVGIFLGLAASLFLGQFLSAILFRTAPSDGATLTAASTALLLTVLLACYLPARRAARLDPTRTLRYE